MTEGRDIRDLTRAINSLTRVTEALNNTLVEVERGRQTAAGISVNRPSSSPKGATESIYGICSSCMRHKCLPNKVHSPSCDCCKTNHDLN